MDPSKDVKSDSQEEELSPELQELLLTLHSERGWWTAHIYQYQGFWYPSKQLQGLIAFQQHLQARDSDIILAASPKSGMTWLKSIVFAIMNRSNLHRLLTTNPHDLIPSFEFRIFGHNRFPDLSNLPSPRIFATHVPYSSLPISIRASSCRIVYVCRNPKDNLVSYWHFTSKLRPQNLDSLLLDEAHELFCKGVSPFGPFWDHVLSYWKESVERPKKVLFVKYEEMKEDIVSQIKRLAEHMDCAFSLEEESEGVVEEISRLCSFEHMSNLEVNMSGKTSFVESKTLFRKGVVGDWVNHFTPSMAERLDLLTKQKLQGSGLTFDAR